MEYPYSIKDISSKVGKTVQSLYTLIKRNQEFINQNSKKEGRFIKYNQAVLDWFINYYGVSTADATPQDTQKDAQDASKLAADASSDEMALIEAKARIAVLEAENKDLRERLAKCDEEREAANQNLGMALSALTLEKQEKMLLLPSPRKSLIQSLKEAFSNRNRKNNSDQSDN